MYTYVYICIHSHTYMYRFIWNTKIGLSRLDWMPDFASRIVDPWDFGSQDRLCQAVWVSGTSTDLFPTRLWYAEAWEE